MNRSPKRTTRALLFTRNFWPHGSFDSASHVVDIAKGLQAAGLHVSVATPKHANAWPQRFTFQEFEVHRPVRMFKLGWTARADRSPSRYIRNWRDWLEPNPTNCDIVVCFGGREEAIAAVSAAEKMRVPAIVVLMGDGDASDLLYYPTSRGAARCQGFVQRASAVVVGSSAQHRSWLSIGGDRQTTHRIEAGIGPAIDSKPATRKKLRRALAQINGDLFVPDGCSVVLSVERMRKESGLMTLVESAYGLSEKIGSLQYWLIGDGPRRDWIYSRLRGDGLRQVTSMPGSYGTMDDLFATSDLIVHSGHEGFMHQIPRAIAADLPVIVADHEVSRAFFGCTTDDVANRIIQRRADASPDGNATAPNADDETESVANLLWWFNPRRPKTLRFAVEEILANVNRARERSATLRRIMQSQRPRDRAIEAYKQLISQLTDDSL